MNGSAVRRLPGSAGRRSRPGLLDLTIGSYQISASVLPDGTVMTTYLYVTGQGAPGNGDRRTLVKGASVRDLVRVFPARTNDQ